tara:strand:- start:1128 stop:2837 length:1710 start_codon:yes stop_codon:yes gene_type:complete
MEEILFPIVAVVVLAAATSSRCTNADIVECGQNEIEENNSCVCEAGYIRSYTGNCDQCAAGYLQSTENGKMVCKLPQTEDKRVLGGDFEKNEGKFYSQLTDTKSLKDAMFRPNPFQNSNLLSRDNFTLEGQNTPGFYPAYSTYKQIPFASNEDILARAADNVGKQNAKVFLDKEKIAAPTRNRQKRYSNVFSSKSIHDMPYNFIEPMGSLKKIKSDFKIDEEITENPGVYPNKRGTAEYTAKTVVKRGNLFENDNIKIIRNIEADFPQPQDPIKNAGVQDSAGKYALDSMGINFENPTGQLTQYSTGDVMTSYKPINELMRPISMPVLTNRLEERQVKYDPTPTSDILAPPIPIDELNKKKKQGEDLARIPFPTQGSYIAEKHRSALPEIDVGDTLQVWNAANPFYEITGKYNSRRETIFRNKRQVHIPNTMGQGFYGDHLNPLKNITNSDKFFFAGEEGMRHITQRDDRHNDRILAEPRGAFANIDVSNLVRSIPSRSTSNKTQKEKFDTDESRLYYNFSKEPPIRSSRITSKKQVNNLLSYSQPFIMPPNISNRDALAIGPPNTGSI